MEKQTAVQIRDLLRANNWDYISVNYDVKSEELTLYASKDLENIYNRKDERLLIENAEVIIEYQSNSRIWILIVFGLSGLIFGGKLVDDNAIEIATVFGVSKKVIGLTIIAAGTSLPELVTSIVAGWKKNSDIAIGNVIGSNIFNLLFVLSISSIINPVQFNTAFNKDIYLLIGGTIFLLIAMTTGQRMRLDRWEAGILFLVFIGYTIYLLGNEI